MKKNNNMDNDATSTPDKKNQSNGNKPAHETKGDIEQEVQTDNDEGAIKKEAEIIDNLELPIDLETQFLNVQHRRKYKHPFNTFYDSEQHTDQTRKGIAYSLIALVGFQIVFIFFLVAFKSYDVEKIAVFGFIFNPTIALLSAAIGFYFGQGNNGRQ
jgi:hypothetical protein